MKAALDAMPGISTPNLLISLWRRKLADAQVLRRVLLEVWKFIEHPSHWPRDIWRAMFRSAGFLSDGAPRPKPPVTVYRGCSPKGRLGLAWTKDRGTADWFGDYWVDNGQAEVRGNVYKARVKPSDTLAIVRGVKTSPDGSLKSTGLGRPEFEYICDIRSTRVILVETAKARIERLAQEERVERYVKASAAAGVTSQEGRRYRQRYALVKNIIRATRGSRRIRRDQSSRVTESVRS